MKCIKSIKETKTYKVGDIVRVSDKEADVRVESGYWMYVPKTEWKEFSRKPVEIEKTDEKPDLKLKKNQKRQNIEKKQRKVEK